MSFINNSLKTFGIEKDGSFFRTARVYHKRGKIIIDKLEILSKGNVKPLYNSYPHSPIIGTLASSAVLTRTLELPLAKDRDLPSLVRFQMEPQLPYSQDNAILSYTKQEIHSGKIFLKVFSAKREQVGLFLSEVKEEGFDLEGISCIPAALTAYGQFRFSSENILFVHLCDEETSCILVALGKLVGSYSIPMGSRHLNELSENNLSLDRWIKEITRILFVLQKAAPVEQFILTGQASKLANLSLSLSEKLSLKVINSEEEHLFAVPIGLAIERLEKGENAVNFLQGSFARPYPWKRLIKPLSFFTSLTILLAFLTFLLGQVYFSQREDELKVKFAELVLATSPSLIAFEEDFRNKNHLTPLEGQSFALKSLTESDITSRLYYLDKKLKATPEVFPLQPNIARVSDFLAWLSTHPQVVGTKEDGNKQALIQIESFFYALVKRPDNQHKNEKYQVKVELEFTTPTPKEARQFHDALIAANSMIDSKSEVKWTTSKGKYRASFLLKDKTSYPSLNSGANR